MLYKVGFNISDLSRRYKDKVKNLLEGGYKIELNNDRFTSLTKGYS